LEQSPREVLLIPIVPRSRFLGVRVWTWAPFLICLAPACLSCPAQGRIFDATVLRGSTDLAADWLVHVGDRPEYASPVFDDSAWTPFNAQEDDLHNMFPNSRPEIVWYRMHVRLARDQLSMSFHATNMPRAFEIYTNGVLLAHGGQVVPFVPYDTSGYSLLSIPTAQLKTGSLLIALRIRIDPFSWSFPRPGFQSYQLAIGAPDTMLEHHGYWVFGPSLLPWLDDLVNVALMLGALLLYLTQRDRVEYLWLFLWIAISLPIVALSLYSTTHTFPLTWHIIDLSFAIWPYFMSRTYCAFVGHRIGWKLNLYLAFAGVVLALNYWDVWHAGQSLHEAASSSLAEAILELVILPVILIACMRRGDRESGFLLLPLILTGLTNAGTALVDVLTLFPKFRDEAFRLQRAWTGVEYGSFIVNYAVVADILSMFSLALIILIRSIRISRQHAFLESEIANAQEVQQVILPEACVTLPGLIIESEYRPAREVGGDFFQIIPHKTDGSLLIVAGDVTGKGLRAGMLVALLVGAIRTAAETSNEPKLVLDTLNRRLLGRGDAQATCLALRIASDCTVTLANAGHLAPYLNGEQLPMEGALPLGMIEGAGFSVMQFQLNEHDKLVLISDGIAEATDADGQLFGFERVHQLVRRAKSAAEVANAAQNFGQEDDISVVCVTRTPVMEPTVA